MRSRRIVTADQFAKLQEQVELQSCELSALHELLSEKPHRNIFRNRRLLVASLLCLVGIPLLHAAVPNSFSAGSPAVAADVNANFTHLYEVSVPVGGIIGWHKSLGSVPALPASGKWVECNGQVLSDAGSLLNGQTIPNLNGAAGGADSPGQSAGVKAQMFLRGGTTSGTGQQDAFQGHWHWIHSGYRNVAAFTQALVPGNGAGSTPWPGGWPTLSGGSGANTDASTGVDVANQNPGKFFATTEVSNETSGSTATNPGSTGGADRNHGTPRTANETRPRNMSVVWIMRVK